MVSLEWRNLDFRAEVDELEDGAAAAPPAFFSPSSTSRKRHLHILKSVSGRVEAGRTLAILGPSGSGKTSLLKMLGGQTKPGLVKKPATGEIYLNGERIDYADYPYSAGVRLVSFVEQQDLFVGNVTVAEHLAFHADLRLFHLSSRERKARVRKALKRLRLTHCANRIVGRLSGGELGRERAGLSASDRFQTSFRPVSSRLHSPCLTV